MNHEIMQCFEKSPVVPPFVAAAWARCLEYFQNNRPVLFRHGREHGLLIPAQAWLPTIRSGPRIGRHTVYLPFDVWRWRFGFRFKCYYGDFWFTGNRKIAEILLNPTDEHIKLRRHLRFRIVPDECYYQTTLGNVGSLVDIESPPQGSRIIMHDFQKSTRL